MFHKTLTKQLTCPHLGIGDDEQYYTHPVNIDIMKYLVSKGHCFSLLEIYI